MNSFIAKFKEKDKAQLIEELILLHNEVKRLKTSEKTYIHIKDVLQKKTHALGERVKELNCLYAMSSLVQKRRISLEDILQGIARIIPPAWQYPAITCARIILKEKIFVTDNFRESPWKQSATIYVKGKKTGLLEVYYLEEKPLCDEGPFLKEERSLIDVIAKHIGEIIERKTAEDALKESMLRNNALLNAIPDMIFRIDNKGIILDFKRGKALGKRFRSNMFIGKNVLDLPMQFSAISKEIIKQGMYYVMRSLRTKVLLLCCPHFIKT